MDEVPTHHDDNAKNRTKNLINLLSSISKYRKNIKDFHYLMHTIHLLYPSSQSVVNISGQIQFEIPQRLLTSLTDGVFIFRKRTILGAREDDKIVVF